MGKEDTNKIIIETYSPGFSKKYDLSSITIHNLGKSKITLVIDGANIILYEGKEFKNCAP